MTNKLRSVITLGFTALLLSSCTPAKDNCTKYVNATDIKLINNRWIDADDYLITYEDGTVSLTSFPSLSGAKCVAREAIPTSITQ